MKTCLLCGDTYRPAPNEAIEVKICDECFEMENNENMQSFDEFSDADSGL